MRILFFGAHFPRPTNPTIGTWALSQMTALRDAGHEVRVISPIPAVPTIASRLMRQGTSAQCPKIHAWNGIETRYVRWPVYPVGPLGQWVKWRPDIFVKAGWILTASTFERQAKTFSPEVVFAHHGHLSGFVASNVARKLQIPFFITEHSFGEIESCLTNPHRNRHYAEMLRGISGWIAVANRLRDSMERIFPDAPAITVHNGAELIPDSIRYRPRPPALAGRLVILCATFFYKRKSVPLLIKSFDRIAKQHPDALLLIVGDGEDRQAVATAYSNAVHRRQIEVLGALDHREVLQHMAWCDVFAQIGVDEPFATVFSEAMMAGKPIVYASDGGITDIAVSGMHGFGVTPGDEISASIALDTLLGDAALRKRLGEQAMLLSKSRLTWPQNAKSLTALFERANLESSVSRRCTP